MEVTIKVKLKPFTVPNFVLVDERPQARDEGFKEGRKYALNEIDEYSLAKLCDDFKSEVFRKAGKDMPPISA